MNGILISHTFIEVGFYKKHQFNNDLNTLSGPTFYGRSWRSRPGIFKGDAQPLKLGYAFIA